MTHLIFHSNPIVFVVCICVHLLNTIHQSEALNTFVVSFQSDGSWSTDQWMKYNKKIVGIEKEFTLCHWERLRYFSTGVNAIWAYCYIKYDSDNKLGCWQLYSTTNIASAGRNVNLIITTPLWYAEAQAIPYRHRQWNHFCFTYSAINKVGKLYYNGKLIKEDSERKRKERIWSF